MRLLIRCKAETKFFSFINSCDILKVMNGEVLC